MSDELLRRIQQAQVQAGEDAVVDDLRAKGLLPPKLAVIGNLATVEALVHEYLAQLAPRDRLESELRFSHFLIYLRKRQERMEAMSEKHNID